MEQADVDPLLIEAVPEIADQVRCHREEWPDDFMHYMLVSYLFGFLTSPVHPHPDGGRDIIQRAYDLVERAMTDGTPEVKNLFVIEMLEPLALGEPFADYPAIERAMGPATLRELAEYRAKLRSIPWGRSPSANR